MHPTVRLSKAQAVDAWNALYTLRKNHRRHVTLSSLAREYVESAPPQKRGSTLTLRGLCERFYTMLPREQIRNRSSYRSVFRHVFRTLNPRMRATSLSEAHVTAVLAPYIHPTSYTSVLRRLNTVLNWGVRHQHLKINPAALVDSRIAMYREPSFYRVERVEAILAVAKACGSREIQVFLTLGFYAGLRTSEILRTRLADIHLEESFIRIPNPKGITCGGKPRIVELEPKAVALLRECLHGAEGADALVAPSAWQVTRWKKRCLEPSGISWGNDTYHNVMRHTYATMHVAAFRNAAATSLNLGHTGGSAVLNNHYKGLVSHAEAVQYWQMPDMPQATQRDTEDARSATEQTAVPVTIGVYQYSQKLHM